MSVATRLKEELRAVGLYTLFFAAWFSVFVLLKVLILAEYEIRSSGVTAGLVGALILAKVVLLLEHVPLGAWVQRRPAWVDVAVRTLLYGIGVLLVLLLEKAFELRHEAGGLLPSLARLLEHEDVPHVIANAICVTGALLVFNGMSVVRGGLGPGGLARLFTAPRA
ncbi:MAG: hypothetical protein ACM3O5_09510 [Betaproteobacteria bacterium]